MMAYQQSMSCSYTSTSSSSSMQSKATAAATSTLLLSKGNWRKSLTKLPKKWIRLKPNTTTATATTTTPPFSGTVAAAATEKLIRRPQATVQTEDLTASQFALMAGIKIKRGRNHSDKSESHLDINYDDSEEDSDSEDDDSDIDGMLPVTLDGRQLQQLTTKITATQHGSVPCMTSYSSPTARSHSIWDARFWQQQQQEKQKQKQYQSSAFFDKSLPPPPPCSILSSSTDRFSDLSTNDTVSSSASTLETCHSANLTSDAARLTAAPFPRPRVFHKGRFKIVMGDANEDDDSDDQQQQHQSQHILSGEPLARTISTDSNNVMEWHRKRAMTH